MSVNYGKWLDNVKQWAHFVAVDNEKEAKKFWKLASAYIYHEKADYLLMAWHEYRKTKDTAEFRHKTGHVIDTMKEPWSPYNDRS